MTKADKMREQFEAAVIARFKESGFLEVEIRVECLGRSGDGYQDGSVDAYWHFWKSSREAVVVELPDMADKKYWECFEDVEGGSFVFPKYIAHVETAIKIHGLRVAS